MRNVKRKDLEKSDLYDPLKLAEEIIGGRRLLRGEYKKLFKECDLEALVIGADRIRKYYVGDRVDMCTIIAGKSGNCGENCRFCAQSVHNKTGCEVYDLMDYEDIYKAARSDQEEGVDRFAVVVSGRSPSDKDFDMLTDIYKKLNKELKLSLCASLGFLTADRFERLYEAGVRNYHNNIETSRGYFSSICTTHSFEDKVENIKRAKEAGFKVCSGGIIGMGETMDDRIDMAFDLCELEIDSIPLNVLIPIPGTPLEGLPVLPREEIMRVIAIFRYINPGADIRFAAGRKLTGDNGRGAFNGGASAAITGNMLTTSGSTIKNDLKMLREMGRRE
ncbi:MAG: biotin synthase BioB [Lachnospiraceae bacterium]|nr:biotin synthase BioB [Lachnospiraceae bacterium]